MEARLICEWPSSYIHVTQALLDDQKKHQRRVAYNEIVKDLESELYANKDEDQFYAHAIRAVIERIQSKI